MYISSAPSPWSSRKQDVVLFKLPGNSAHKQEQDHHLTAPSTQRITVCYGEVDDADRLESKLR
jgi:hypothetical protein